MNNLKCLNHPDLQLNIVCLDVQCALNPLICIDCFEDFHKEHMFRSFSKFIAEFKQAINIQYVYQIQAEKNVQSRIGDKQSSLSNSFDFFIQQQQTWKTKIQDIIQKLLDQYYEQSNVLKSQKQMTDLLNSVLIISQIELQTVESQESMQKFLNQLVLQSDMCKNKLEVKCPNNIQTIDKFCDQIDKIRTQIECAQQIYRQSIEDIIVSLQSKDNQQNQQQNCDVQQIQINVEKQTTDQKLSPEIQIIENLNQNIETCIPLNQQLKSNLIVKVSPQSKKNQKNFRNDIEKEVNGNKIKPLKQSSSTKNQIVQVPLTAEFSKISKFQARKNIQGLCFLNCSLICYYSDDNKLYLDNLIYEQTQTFDTQIQGQITSVIINETKRNLLAISSNDGICYFMKVDLKNNIQNILTYSYQVKMNSGIVNISFNYDQTIIFAIGEDYTIKSYNILNQKLDQLKVPVNFNALQFIITKYYLIAANNQSLVIFDALNKKLLSETKLKQQIKLICGVVDDQILVVSDLGEVTIYRINADISDTLQIYAQLETYSTDIWPIYEKKNQIWFFFNMLLLSQQKQKIYEMCVYDSLLTNKIICMPQEFQFRKLAQATFDNQMYIAGYQTDGFVVIFKI